MKHFSRAELYAIVHALECVRDAGDQGLWKMTQSRARNNSAYNCLLDARDCGLAVRKLYPTDPPYKRRRWHLTEKGAQVLKAIEEEEQDEKRGMHKLRTRTVRRAI